MDSVLSDRIDWECPGESTDSGSGSDFTRSRWANDILDAEEKFQKTMITVLTGSAFLAPIVAAFEAAFDSESYCQQLPQSAALRVLLTRDLIPARFKEMTSSVELEVERRFAGVIADMRPVRGARPTGSASFGGWINLYLGPYIKTCMIKNMVKYFVRRPLVVPMSFNQTIFEDHERQKSQILEKQRILQSVCRVAANLNTMMSKPCQMTQHICSTAWLFKATCMLQAVLPHLDPQLILCHKLGLLQVWKIMQATKQTSLHQVLLLAHQIQIALFRCRACVKMNSQQMCHIDIATQCTPK